MPDGGTATQPSVRSEHGQSLLEYAVVLAVLAVIVSLLVLTVAGR